MILDPIHYLQIARKIGIHTGKRGLITLFHFSLEHLLTRRLSTTSWNCQVIHTCDFTLNAVPQGVWLQHSKSLDIHICQFQQGKQGHHTFCGMPSPTMGWDGHMKYTVHMCTCGYPYFYWIELEFSTTMQRLICIFLPRQIRLFTCVISILLQMLFCAFQCTLVSTTKDI